MNKDLINRVTSLSHDLENPQQVITMLMVVDELKRLYALEKGACTCKKERDAEFDEWFDSLTEDDRAC